MRPAKRSTHSSTNKNVWCAGGVGGGGEKRVDQCVIFYLPHYLFLSPNLQSISNSLTRYMVTYMVTLGHCGR